MIQIHSLNHLSLRQLPLMLLAFNLLSEYLVDFLRALVYHDLLAGSGPTPLARSVVLHQLKRWERGLSVFIAD